MKPTKLLHNSMDLPNAFKADFLSTTIDGEPPANKEFVKATDTMNNTKPKKKYALILQMML